MKYMYIHIDCEHIAICKKQIYLSIYIYIYTIYSEMKEELYIERKGKNEVAAGEAVHDHYHHAGGSMYHAGTCLITTQVIIATTQVVPCTTQVHILGDSVE